MLLPFYWYKCNPETVLVFSNIVALLVNSVTTCENKRLGSFPFFVFSYLEILYQLFSVTVSGLQVDLSGNFMAIILFELSAAPTTTHTHTLQVGSCSFCCVTALVVWAR